jgi:tetratricopeptide (TPR) repeat protein
MKTMRTILSAIIIITIAGVSWAQSSEEAAGKAAEQAGKYVEALGQYRAALEKASEGSADEQRLLQAAIRVTQRITPAPAIPEEARRFFIRGQTWVEQAKSTADFEKAAKEFTKARRIAPWWGEVYYSCGVALGKAGKYEDAISNLKFYILASPRAQDINQVKEYIYSLEAQQEAASPERLAGTWRVVAVLEDGSLSDIYTTTSLNVRGNRASGEWLWYDGAGGKFGGVFSGNVLTGDWNGWNSEHRPESGTFRAEVNPDRTRIIFRFHGTRQKFTLQFDRL